MNYPDKIDRKINQAINGSDGVVTDLTELINSRLSESQRDAIDALTSESTLEDVIAALQATEEE